MGKKHERMARKAAEAQAAEAPRVPTALDAVVESLKSAPDGAELAPEVQAEVAKAKPRRRKQEKAPEAPSPAPAPLGSEPIVPPVPVEEPVAGPPSPPKPGEPGYREWAIPRVERCLVEGTFDAFTEACRLTGTRLYKDGPKLRAALRKWIDGTDTAGAKAPASPKVDLPKVTGPRFYILVGPQRGRELAIPEGISLLGRMDPDIYSDLDPVCLDLSGSEPDGKVSVSRKHALVRRRGSSVSVEDAGSANGTLVDFFFLDCYPGPERDGGVVSLWGGASLVVGELPVVLLGVPGRDGQVLEEAPTWKAVRNRYKVLKEVEARLTEDEKLDPAEVFARLRDRRLDEPGPLEVAAATRS